MYYFTLPNFYDYGVYNSRLIFLSQHHKEFFSLPVIFTGQEGAFPYFSWNGGTNLNNFKVYVDWQEMRDLYSHVSDKILFDCSNPLLEDCDFYDRHQNMLLELNDNGSNMILVSNPALMRFLNEQYPYYKYIASPYYEIYDPELKDLSSFIRIRTLPKEEVIKLDIPLEMSVISGCSDCLNNKNCCLEHWNGLLSFSEHSPFKTCQKNNIHILTVEELEQYYKKGIQYFYFETYFLSQCSKNDIIKIYLDLFIKKEHRYLVKNFLIEGTFDL